MARDGSGNYSRVEGPYQNGDVADATDMNAELDDFATAVSDSINRNGTKAFAADQSMGGFKLTDLAAPSSNNDAARKAYVDSAISGLSATYQPLDATLTALAALSYTSGTLLIRETAADTFELASDALYAHLAGTETITGAKTFSAATVISLNASSLPSPTTGTILRLANADGANTVFQFDTFGGVNLFDARSATGTAASPSAVGATNNMFQISARGYGATAYAGGARWAVRCTASENWTDSAQGTYGSLFSSPLGGASNTERYRWGDFTSTMELGYRDGGPGSVKTADYTFALTDRGTPTDHNDGSAHAFLVPANATVAFPANAILYGTNWGAGTLTIDRAVGVTIRDATGTDADLTVPQYGRYMIQRHPSSADVWIGRVY